MLEAVVCKSLGPSTGPDNLLFKRFKKKWAKSDQSDIKPLFTMPRFSKTVENVAADRTNNSKYINLEITIKSCLILRLFTWEEFLKKEFHSGGLLVFTESDSGFKPLH